MLLRNLKFYKIQSGLPPGNIHLSNVQFIDTNELIFFTVLQVSKSSSNVALSDDQQSPADSVTDKQAKPERKSVVPTNCRYVYPEFLPDPKMEWRNSLREKLERMDMIQRRKHIDIPEFYVGR